MPHSPPPFGRRLERGEPGGYGSRRTSRAMPSPTGGAENNQRGISLIPRGGSPPATHTAASPHKADAGSAQRNTLPPLSLSRPTSNACDMPGIQAWQKPTVNKKHKAAVQQQAQNAAASGDGQDEIQARLYRVVNNSELKEERKREAKRAVKEACSKMASGNNPLAGLKPPPSCVACRGIHGSHHFLCQGKPGKQRRQSKNPVEQATREIIQRKLNKEWSDRTAMVCTRTCCTLNSARAAGERASHITCAPNLSYSNRMLTLYSLHLPSARVRPSRSKSLTVDWRLPF